MQTRRANSLRCTSSRARKSTSRGRASRRSLPYASRYRRPRPSTVWSDTISPGAWNCDDQCDDLLPDTEDMDWGELSVEEQQFATEICYFEELWEEYELGRDW